MAKNKPSQQRRDPAPIPAAAAKADAPGGQFVVVRETIESIVVAFVLAFLFRTFEAEAFVIPTGSMAPSLQGQHKDVECAECGYSFRTTASSEGEERDRLLAQLRDPRGLDAESIKRRISGLDVVGGMCPMCRSLMPMRDDLPPNVRDEVDLGDVEYQPSYPGDRILVNKFGLDFSEPERWDVVVFKFPGDGNMNYIKRLVGLPGETLEIYQGDIFTRPLEDAAAEFKIVRKPPDKVEAMLQPVHDTDYEASTLYNAGWPLRWAATTADGWQVEAAPGERDVAQHFSVEQPDGGELAWLRYRHLLPDDNDWQIAKAVAADGSWSELAREADVTEEQFQQAFQHPVPQLIVDFNPYNARLTRDFAAADGWQLRPRYGHPHAGSTGTEWVGDLAVECNVDVQQARGELLLDVVEAGYHFRAAIDLADGKVALSIVDGRTGEPLEGFQASGQAEVGAGEHSFRLANVDDQLLLWVDGDLVDCGDATYDPDRLFGGRESMIPWAGGPGADQGDLAPAGVGARGATLRVNRLAVLRDIYYIATKYPEDQSNFVFDFAPTSLDPVTLFSTPEHWHHFATRQRRQFEVKPGQLFVMGDNSPESKDCRLWLSSQTGDDKPGGPYLDRRLLIGKAICVFWPHSWGSIPGLPFLPGFPNFGDMRLVR